MEWDLSRKGDAIIMADISCKPFTRAWRLPGVVLACLVMSAVSGCVLLENSTATHPPEPPPLPVNEVLSIWDKSLRFAQDPTRGGAMLPGLAGRVYLLNDALKCTVDAGGSIHVVIRNVTPGAPANPAYYEVKCEFKEQDLKRLKKKDMIDNGYTLFVPWETYRPDIKQVEVQVCYTPRGGSQHYSAPTPITIQAENRIAIEQSQRVFGPAGPQQGAGPPQMPR